MYVPHSINAAAELAAKDGHAMLGQDLDAPVFGTGDVNRCRLDGALSFKQNERKEGSGLSDTSVMAYVFIPMWERTTSETKVIKCLSINK